MFSCCLPTSQGSGLRRSLRRGVSRTWRNSARVSQDACGHFLRGVKMGNTGAEGRSAKVPLQDEKESSLTLDTQACLEFLKMEVRESMVNHLVRSLLQGNSSFPHEFLKNCQVFGTTQQVLDLLLKRCDSLMASTHSQSLHYSSENGGPLDQLKSAISTILGTWLEKYPDQFQEPPEFACLKQLVEYVQLHLPGSDLEHRAHLLLAQLEDTQTMKAKPGAQAAAPVPGPTGEGEAAPAAASKPAVDPPPILGQELAAVPAPWPGAPRKPPRVIPKKKQTGTETLELEPARAGPLLPVVPSWPSPMTMKTRDSTWLQRGKKAKEQRAATVCSTVIHLPSVAQCVISTVLRHYIMEASARTQVVEHGVSRGPQERQMLRNRASLSGLRISVIQSLMQTWQDFSRWLFLSIGATGEPVP